MVNRKFMSKLLGCGILGLVFSPFTSAAQTNVYIQNYLYPGSSYTAVTPVGYKYFIRDARELNWVSYMVTQGYTFQGCTIEIVNDIDCRNEDFMPIGTYYTPFQGTINGNGYWIKNLTLNYPDYYGIGLVGFLGYNGIVRDINVGSSCRFTAYSHVGGVVGWNSGQIIHCSSSANLFAVNDFVGGIVGYNDAYGIVNNCEVCSLSERNSGFGREVGTFIGENYGKRYKNCRTFLFYPW